MDQEVFKYGLLAVFVTLTFYLSWIGMKKTKDIRSFAIGNKDINPVFIGITMMASVSSTATFVINPGFLYQDGLSAYIHYGVSALAGMLAAILVISKGFRRLGVKQGSLTIPGWLNDRYGHRGLSLYFAFINLLTITFIILILVGCSILMSSIFPVSQKAALVLCLLFVFSYVLMGGTYAHIYTNTFQGFMMLFISIFVIVQGFKYFDGGFIAALESVGPNYASVINPDSNLYNDFFSVFISGFVVTFALMLQPHILSKVLYIKDESHVRKFVITCIVVGAIFGSFIVVGIFARLAGIETDSMNTVVTQYLQHEFSATSIGPYLLPFITITLLAAGLSTLDGILVALSAMVVSDIYRPFAKTKSPEEFQRKGLILSRWVLVSIGVISLIIAWDPPRMVGLFAQKGIYGLAAATLVPVLFGVIGPKKINPYAVFTASLIGLLGHLYLNIFGGVYNPAVSSSIAALSSVAFFLTYLLYIKVTEKETEENGALAVSVEAQAH